MFCLFDSYTLQDKPSVLAYERGLRNGLRSRLEGYFVCVFVLFICFVPFARQAPGISLWQRGLEIIFHRIVYGYEKKKVWSFTSAWIVV